MEQKKLKIINLFGSPGIGKSATRSGLFWLLKVKGASVEEVSEYAKYLVLSDRKWQLDRDQLYVVAQQHHKMLILEGSYEFAVTDSPLLLASFYAPSATTPPSFHPMCEEYSARFENVNFFLTRDLSEGAFEKEGRMHGREEAIRLEGEQKDFLAKKGIGWIDIELDHKTPWALCEHISRIYPGKIPPGGPMAPEMSPR